MRKLIGSILIIMGTAIGAGMIALPVATSQTHIFTTLVMLLASWILMTIGAFTILEVNLWFNAEANLISMADQTLGKAAKAITWIAYLILFYSLICAYLSGISDILHSLLLKAGVNLPAYATTTLGLITFGTIVFRGIGAVDLVNRGLMSIKLLAYVLLVIIIAPHISWSNLNNGDHQWRMNAGMIMMTSFGFAATIPSLRTYLNSDAKKLKLAVFFGGLMPLIIYTAWIITVQGLITRNGATGLLHILASNQTNSLLMQSIGNLLHANWMADVARLFISICAITSFLGVSIGVMDFIRDGLQLKHNTRQQWLTALICFTPPYLIVLVAPGIFMHALDYAGILCLFLLVLLPLAMLYAGRYIQKRSKSQLVPVNQLAIIALALMTTLLIAFNL